MRPRSVNATDAVQALNLARQQIVLRVAQLSNCRVCGADLQRFEEAQGVLLALIQELENPDGIRTGKGEP